MATSSNGTVTLRSSDGELFEVEKHVALQCETIKHMIEDDCTDSVIPLSNVSSKALAKVIQYCKEHAESGGVRTPEETSGEWDKEFVNVDRETLLDLILAANYLDNKGLLDLTCQTMADSIKDKSVEEIRDVFNIENDYTPEEEEAVRKEHAWVWEKETPSGSGAELN